MSSYELMVSETNVVIAAVVGIWGSVGGFGPQRLARAACILTEAWFSPVNEVALWRHFEWVEVLFVRATCRVGRRQNSWKIFQPNYLDTLF